VDEVMTNLKRLTLTLIAAVGLFGCATTRGLSAAGDVHALLLSIRDDDRPAFDAHVDRRALAAQIQGILVDRTRAANVPDSVKSLGLLVSGSLAKAAAGALIRPDVFRAIANYYGYRPDTPIPGTLAIAMMLRPVEDDRVCATKGKHGPCLLTFANEDGTWRLIEFNGNAAMLKLGKGGAP
jgi:hypothetical protein